MGQREVQQPMLFGADLSGMCLVILHDFPHQYTGQSTPHCLSAMVSPVLSATGQHQVDVSILFYRRSHPPLPGALESQPTPQEMNRTSTRPPQELIQTVAAATHAHARNPSQETIPCYKTPHDYGAMAPAAGEHRHANGVG